MKKFFQTASLLGLVFALLLTAVACKAGNNDTPKQTTPEEVAPESTTPQDTRPEDLVPHEHYFGSWQNPIDLAEGDVGEQTRTCSCGETEARTVQASAGLAFSLNDDGKTCTVTGIGDCSDIVLHIPEYINGYRVTGIAKRAFYEVAQLVEVTVPNGVTTLEFSTFSCRKLKKINLPNGLESIGEGAFVMCHALESVFIPAGVKNLDPEAFSVCKMLSEIVVDKNNVTYYSQGNCIIERESKTLIIGCAASVIPNDVKCIGERAFGTCSNLVSITIPEGVECIEQRAFEHCPRLESVTLPKSITEIQKGAFALCDVLQTVTYNGTTEKWGELSIAPSWCTATPLKEVACSNGSVVLEQE